MGCQIEWQILWNSGLCPVPSGVAGHPRRDGTEQTLEKCLKEEGNGRIEARGSVGTSEISKRHEEFVGIHVGQIQQWLDGWASGLRGRT